jgi:hypothetical protein
MRYVDYLGAPKPVPILSHAGLPIDRPIDVISIATLIILVTSRLSDQRTKTTLFSAPLNADPKKLISFTPYYPFFATNPCHKAARAADNVYIVPKFGRTSELPPGLLVGMAVRDFGIK